MSSEDSLILVNSRQLIFFLKFPGDSGGPIILPGQTPEEDLQVGIISWYVNQICDYKMVKRGTFLTKLLVWYIFA